MTAAEWDEISGHFFRKRKLYECEWKDENDKILNLNHYKICGASFGGPIALIEDETKIPRGEKGYHVRIYLPTGKLISCFPFRGGRGFFKMGWSAEEYLVIVTQDATVMVYDMHGKVIREFSMGQECVKFGVADCSIWGTGLVVRTAPSTTSDSSIRLWACMSLTDPLVEPFPLANPNFQRPPTCILALDPSKTRGDGVDSQNNRDVEVLVATAEKEIWCISREQKTKLLTHDFLIRDIKLSPNSSRIAMVDDSGLCHVWPHDLSKAIWKIHLPKAALNNSGNDRGVCLPLDMQWCGVQALVLLYTNHLFVCYEGEYVDYPYSDDVKVALVSEPDCIRIMTSEGYEYLSLVSPSTKSIFQFGSTEPGATLMDSYDEFSHDDPHADSHRRELKDDVTLQEAVYDCLDAARYELDDKEIQQKLLAAAAYGKLFIKDNGDDYGDNEFSIHARFVETCRQLRVLNAMRDKNVGMPLTCQEFEGLTPSVVIQRLINRRQHLLAIRIAQYLQIPCEEVLEHWAICKIDTAPPDMPDETLVEEIRAKLIDFPTFSYSKIANEAKQRSSTLAIKLIEFEPRAREQVQKLIEFQQYEIALQKALMSLDSDLINEALLKLILKYDPRSNDSTGIDSNRRIVAHRQLFELINKYSMHARELQERASTVHSVGSTGDRSSYSSSNEANVLAYQLPHQLLINMCEYNSKSDSANIRTSYKEMLSEYYQYIHDYKHLAQQSFKYALCLNDIDRRIECLDESLTYYEKDKSLNFHLRMTADYKRLLIYQQRADDGSKNTETTQGKSVLDTLRVLIERDDLAQANELRKQFELSNKLWWHTLCDTFSRCGKWDAMEQYIEKNTNKRNPPPIGYLSIIELCVQHKQIDRAKFYILKLNDLHEKLEWLCQLKLWNDAVEVAFNEKAMDALYTIQRSCKDPNVLHRIEQMLAKI